MSILLIDNNTLHLKELKSSLAGHVVEIRKYHPGLDLETSGKDLVILSGGGGEGKEANDHTSSGDLWYKDEIDFIRSCDKPLVGICMGFELICQAYGGRVEQLPKLISGFKQIPAVGKVFESHQWRVAKVPEKHFKVLARSKSGVELIKHKTRPIIASQFHPEIKGGQLALNELIATVSP